MTASWRPCWMIACGQGIETLTARELRGELRDRGLPIAGLSTEQMRSTLSNWLQLSQKKEIPYTLLILMNM